MSQHEAFWKDWAQIIENVYSRSDLPMEVVRLRPVAFSYMHYQAAEALLRVSDQSEARSHLSSILTYPGAPLQLRVLAVVMLVDSVSPNIVDSTCGAHLSELEATRRSYPLESLERPHPDHTTVFAFLCVPFGQNAFIRRRIAPGNFQNVEFLLNVSYVLLDFSFLHIYSPFLASVILH